MKFLLLSSLTFFISQLSAQDILMTIAKDACTCVEKTDLSSEESERNMQIGLCLIESANPYQKELKKKYQVNLDNLDSREGEEFGRLIGMKMVTICPDVFLQINQMSKEKAASKFVLTGTIQSLEKGQFYKLAVLDENQRNFDLLWLTDFGNSYDLLKSIETIRGLKVVITYEEVDFFDPNINEYRRYKVIKNLEWK